MSNLPGGGAIYNYGAGVANPPTVTVEHCTFLGNLDASGAAGAIRGNYTTSYHTAAVLKNCVLVNNQAPAAALRNFAGDPTGLLTASYTSLGGNVTDESITSSQFMSVTMDKASAANLGATVSPALALNGGAIPTHALTRGSPAQHLAVPSTVATDERGALRHPIADAGAFELIEPLLSVSATSGPLGEPASLYLGTSPIGTALMSTLTITNTQTSPFATGPLSLSVLSIPSSVSINGFPVAGLGNGQSATLNITLNATNTGAFSVPLTFEANDLFNPSLALATPGLPNQHVIDLSGLITDTVTHWRTQNFGLGAMNTGLAADSANPAGDGIVNLLKYTLGLDPAVAYPPSTSITTGVDGNGHLMMRVSKNPLAGDVNLAIEVSGDIGNPTSWSSNQTTVDQSTSTVFQAHDNIPQSGAPARFIHLKVTRQ